MRGANLKHAVHAHDPGRVEAQRLVEHRRVLPNKEKKHKKKGRHAGRGGRCGLVTVQAACRKAPTVGVEGRAGAERTAHPANMYLMSVTLDVSRLSGWLNADANCRVTRESI